MSSIRTKILATLGPASTDPATLRAMVEAGCDMFRLNFSHGTPDQHGEALDTVRTVEADLNRPIAVLADLCGPKIRVGPVAGDGMRLGLGDEVVVQRAPVEGRDGRISTTLPEIIDEVRSGETLLLDDGKLALEVTASRPPDEVACRVTRAGLLTSGKGINLPDTDLALAALTEKDRADLEWIVGRDVDFVALSFVRSATDVADLREILEANRCDARIVAKIEKPQALAHIEEIVEEADGIMVARGDLGVEMDLTAVPVAQKRIARLCQQSGKCCIVATQMLETMTTNPVPTRAEVSDVANAVLDHTDAVMLSGETAVGRWPVDAVRTMNDIVSHVQAYHDEVAHPVRIHFASAALQAALGSAVREIMSQIDVAAVATYTVSGTTARMLSKCRLPCPIIAMSPEMPTVRRMCLYYGVEPSRAEAPEHTRDVLSLVSRFALDRGLARRGQRMIVVTGRPIGLAGASNTIVVHTVL